MTYEEKVKQKIEEMKARPGEFIEFEGMNCDDCPGWNGVDRRCECGNRRVYWEEDDHGNLWATAY